MYPFEDTNYEIRTEIGILQGKIFKTFLNIMTGFFFPFILHGIIQDYRRKLIQYKCKFG